VKVEWINPFLKATMDTFSTMLMMEVKPGKPSLLTADNNNKDISGVIGLSGSLKGAAVIGFPEEIALKVCSNLVGEEFTELNPDVSDAVGEIANIIVGYAKKYFPENDLEISLPSVIRGPKHMVTMPASVQVVRIPFSCDAAGCENATFTVEIGIREV
jgi:chemotaxis protein CheX